VQPRVSYWDFAKTEEFKKLIVPEKIDDNEIKLLNYKNNQKIEIKTINDIVTGKYLYVHDMVFPKMLHARIIRPPNYYSKFVRFKNNFDKKLIELDIYLIV